MIRHLLVVLFIATMTTFGYSLGTIEGIVWLDDNADGIKDLTEGGISGVSVSLINNATGLQVGSNVVTNFAGAYSFANLAPGDYYVRFNTPFPQATHRVSPMNVGGDDTVDSDASTTAPHVTSAEVQTITANELIDNVFLGLFLSANISGIVWHDVNGDGQRAGGDGNAPQNVNVTLFDATTGTVVTTNASGGALTNPVNTNNAYQFNNLPPGDYYVEFSEPGGVYPTGMHLTLQQIGATTTDSDPDRVTGQSDVITLSGVNVTNIDAGYFLVGQVGDYVWEDLNGDGQQGGTEPGLGGIIVELVFSTGGTALDVDGNPMPTVVSAGSGAYLFDQVPPGSYQVAFEVAPTSGAGNTLYFTQQNIGADVTDSDANRTTGLSQPPFVIVSAGPENIDVDAGYVQKCTISDFTWHDLNGNGIQDGGEPGLDVNILITKISPAGPFTEVDGTTAYIPGITSSGGAYIYDNLPPGEYKLTFTKPANYYFTLQNAGSGTDDSDPDRLTGMTVNITCNSGDELDEYDAGFFTKCTIGDFVWHDLDGDGQQGAEPGLGGIEITITDVNTGNPVAFGVDGLAYPAATINSTGGGAYIFDNLPPGMYKLTFSDPSATYKLTQLDIGGDDKDNDADINMGGMTRDYTCNSDEMLDHVDAGFFRKAVLRGIAWHDSDGDGLQGGSEPLLANVQFTIINTTGPTLDFDGNPVTPEITDASGQYSFTNLRPGIYTMTAALPGWLFTIPLASGGPNDSEFDAGGNLINDVTLLSQEVKNDINAGLYKLITLKGTVWAEGDGDSNLGLPPDNQVIANVTVELCKSVGGSIATTVTNAMGEYTFDNVIPGDYIVKVTADNFATAAPLYGLQTCDGFGSDDDTDNDDNGDGPALGPVMTAVIALYCGLEPEGPDMTENSTVDFCFKADCGTPNPIAAFECPESDTICDLKILEVFCSRMPTQQGSLVGTPICGAGGTSFHNTSWFAFVAGNGDYTMVFNIFGCVGGGAQAGVYEDCTLANAVICNPNCFTGPFEVSSTLLTPGKVYFFFLDGCNGSVCSYDVDILGDFQQYQIPQIDDIVYTKPCARDTICPNTSVDFEVTSQYDNIQAKFYWKITDPTNISTNITTLDRFLTYTFGNKQGTYKVEVVNIDAKCSLPIDPFSIEVIVGNPVDEDWGTWEVCQNDLAVGWIPPYVQGTSTTNPNNDCTDGWVAGDISNAGTFNKLVTIDGCAFRQKVKVVKLLNSDLFNMDTFLCPGTNLEVGPYKIKNATLNLALSFPNAVGCDSVVNVNLGYLGLKGYVEDLGCSNGNYTLHFVDTLIANNIMPQYPFSYSYIWTDPDGNIVNDGDPDKDSTTINILKSGLYKVTVKQKAKNTVCDFVFTLDVIIGGQLPPTPTMVGTWSNRLCKDNAIATYTAASTEAPSDIKKWIWTVPASAVIVGKKDTSTITVDWSNSTGGKICVAIQGDCAISAPLCDSVVVTPIPVVTLPPLNDLCIGQSLNITANTTPLPSFIYNWNFDGGVASSNIGPGPHTVSWGSAGPKTVTLVINDQNCLSKEAKTSVNVIAPEPAPTVSCEGSLGQVVFSWDAVPGATGYNVNVITSQSGTLSGDAASGFKYTLTNLGLLEQVDIVLTTTTNSPCGNLTSNSGCFAQNCNPPDVVIDPVPDICITAATTPINLVTKISPASSQGGTYVYTGKGIVDAAAGIFDPKLADFGSNTITLEYTSPDQCIKFATVTINVNLTPTADFSITDNVICQDSSITVAYTGNITTGGSYDWSFGDVITAGNGKGPFDLKWLTAGQKTISLTVTNQGCVSSEITKNVTVEPRVGQIDIKCADQQPTEIIVDWSTPPVSNAGNYTLIVDGVALPNTNNLSYTLSGLVPDSYHFFEVIANSNNSCPGTRDTITCKAVNCPKTTILFDVQDTTICLNGNAKPFKITPTITGGLMDGSGVLVWSGKGVDADGNFDPVLAGPSTGAGHKILLTFTEGICQKTKLVTIKVLAQPNAAFSITDKICVNDELDITYSGTANVPLDWKVPAGITITPNGTNKYKTKFATAGTYKLGLVVGNAVCLSELQENTVVVEPKLNLVDIKCTSTLSSVNFEWDDIACASKYEVIVDGVNKGVLTNLNYLASGLAEGQKVVIEVTPESECTCPGEKVTKTCEAKACPIISIKLSTPQDKFCEGTVSAAFQLVATITGSNGSGVGKWSGTGVNGTGLFNPQGLAAGVYELKYEFREENCDFSEKISITIYGNPSLSTLTTSPDCYLYNYGTAIQTTTGGDGNYSYVLDSKSIPLDSLKKIVPGNHTLVVTDGKGCKASTAFKIDPAPSGLITVDGQAEILKGQITSLVSTIKSIPGPLDSIVWTNSAGEVLCSGIDCTSLDNFKPDSSDTYCARAYYNSGCNIEGCFTQIVRPLIEIILPNIIRPGSSNDGFFIESYANIELVKSMSIYDRWGNLVFTRENFLPGPDQANTWDGTFNGKKLVPGVYVYTIYLVKKGGKEETINGDVTVIE